MHELFYPDTRVWDPGLLDRCFLPWEAEMIKRIYVHDGDGGDVWYGHLPQMVIIL